MWLAAVIICAENKHRFLANNVIVVLSCSVSCCGSPAVGGCMDPSGLTRIFLCQVPLARGGLGHPSLLELFLGRFLEASLKLKLILLFFFFFLLVDEMQTSGGCDGDVFV